MRSYLLIALIAFCTSCDNNNQANDDTASTTDMAAATAENNNGNWYKHYVGTVAGQAVAADIHKYGERISGTYYYESQGKLIPIYFSTDTAKPGVYLVEETPERVDSKGGSKWEVSITGNTLSGKWKDDMGNDVYDILMKETPTPYPLSVMVYADTIPYKQGVKEPAVTVQFNLLTPSSIMADDKIKFLKSITANCIGCDTLHKTDIQDCIKAQVAHYFKFYKQSITENDTLINNEHPFSNNYDFWTNMYVAYNANDWLVLQDEESEYTGGAHGYYGSAYINVDMQNNKVWEMEDVMRVDSVKLQRELEKAARKRASMSDNEQIKSKYLADRIMPNGNFILTHKGITFNYTPYEIASYAEGEILLFVPYSSIKDLLTPAFKQRMKMQ